MTGFSADLVKSRIVDLGFNLVGLTRAVSSPTLDAYERWIAQGMHADMTYMARPDRQARRRDLNVILPGVQTMIVVGLDYHALKMPDSVLTDPRRGRIAAYAWGVDYHDVMIPRLETLAAWLRDQTGTQIVNRVYVDTGAILERSHAQQAGLGFIGKNTMLINARRGSYFFLGEILTDLVFDDYDSDTPHPVTMCGSCQRCMAACPTHAFPAPYVLDARRCISYLTIENKGWIDRDLRPLIGNWVYGCDVCQDVCPFTRFAIPSPLFTVQPDQAAPQILDLLRMDDRAFAHQFGGSPIARLKRGRMVRNACVAAGNSGDPGLLAALMPLLSDPDPLVRGHAAWAANQLGGDGNALAALSYDPDPGVRDEIAAILG